MADEIRRGIDDSMLGRLDERTVNLAAAIHGLQTSQEAAHKSITLSMERVQIANKVDADRVVSIIEKHLDDDNTRFSLQNGRISLLETARSYTLGIIAAVTFGLGVAMWFFKP